jgi:hypothetical protein
MIFLQLENIPLEAKDFAQIRSSDFRFQYQTGFLPRGMMAVVF